MRLEFEPNATVFPLVENDAIADAFASTSWDFDSLVQKGVAAAQSGDRDQARKLLSQATAVNPTSEDAWMWLASISEYPEELLAFLNRVLEINPSNEKASEWRSATTSLLAKTFVQRALAARNDGSFDLAEQCLNQALAHDNDCEAAWFWKASIAKSDDVKLELFARVLELNPSNPEAAESIARINHSRVVSLLDEAKSFADSGEWAAATNILNDLVDHESVDVRESALMMMSEVVDTEDQKLEFLNLVIKSNPHNEQAIDTVESIRKARTMAAFDEARSAAAAGERDRAIEILDGFVIEVPDSVDAWLLKSHLCEGLDQKVEALEKALEIDPENAAARSGLEFLSLTFGSNTEQKDTPLVNMEQEAFRQESSAEPFIEPIAEVDSTMSVEAVESFSDELVYESQPVSPLDEEVEFAYRSTEESVRFEEPDAEQVFVSLDQSMVFETEQAPEMPANADEIMIPDMGTFPDFSTRPNPVESVEQVFGSLTEQADPSNETVDSLSKFLPESFDHNPFAAEAPDSTFGHVVDETYAADEPSDSYIEEMSQAHVQPVLASTNLCPFCMSQNDPQAFDCSSCNATMTLSDIEKLLNGTNADKEIVQRSVTAMEAEWNTREFSEAEFTALGIGHFNLGQADSGFKYLQEASRLNPNNVILSGQINTIAIRLDEMRRQHETYDALPKGKKILVVDDSPTVRKLISGKLEKSGHLVVCAVDGVDALAKIEEAMPDLVLLDITMPRMDGYEVCKQIRANPAGKDLPVVMISGKDGFFDKVRGRMAGTSGYVTKPFGPETLMKALETYLLPDSVEIS